jgi:hypothetical protein
MVLFAVVGAVRADLIWDSGHSEYSAGNQTRAYMYNEATVGISGGWIGELRMFNDTHAAVNGGSLGAILTYDHSMLQFAAPSQASLIKAFDSSEVTVYGGNVLSIETVGHAVANIHAGVFSNMEAEDNSSIRLFVEDGYTVDYSGGAFSSGRISGTWLGTTTTFSFDLVDAETMNHLQFVPEPHSILLFLTGYGLLRKKN